jgi:trimeric autotransporter adhesin
MRALLRMMLVCISISQLSFYCLAQVGIINTYVGPSMPVIGAQATTQPIDGSTAVTFDGTGGFYFSSYYQNRVYRVSSDGKLHWIAGSGAGGYSGDGGKATSAQLNHPAQLAVDSDGNLFIADFLNNRIRKVTSGGMISTVAGNGTTGYNGDNRAATSATLYNPTGVAVDSSGNLYIADLYNHRIRKVSSSGIITTVAGNGAAGSGGDGGKATSTQLNNPFAVAIDSTGNFFIADCLNNRIRKVSSSGTITTVAGNGSSGFGGDGGQATSAQLKYPTSVAVDSAGSLFISDGSNNRIRKVSPSGIITTLAGNGVAGFSGDGGLATAAQLSPNGIAVDSTGNLLISESANNRIRMVSSLGIITTVAGSGLGGYSGDGGVAALAQINQPYGVALDSAGNLFVADYGNGCIRKVSSSGIITTVAGTGTIGYSGDGGQATSAMIGASGVAVDSAGNIYILANYRIRKVSSSGIITTIVGTGSGGFAGDGGFATSAQVNNAFGIAVDSAGNLFIADTNNNRIRVVSTSGIITTVAGNGISGYGGDGGKATSAQLNAPRAIAVDSAGNLFIADSGNNVIRKVSSSGIITTVAGNGATGYSGDNGPASLAQFNNPRGIAVDSSGNIFITDRSNSRIRKVSTSGMITTVAGSGAFTTGVVGNGVSGYYGDGGPATFAQLNQPFGAVPDSDGNLFIADTLNNRIRKVSKPNISSDFALSAGGVGQASTVGGNPDPRPGYATVALKSGKAPYGTAVFSFKEGGITVSEAGVPASPPTTSARVFIDYRSGVNAIPARSNAGVVEVNTGIAVVNYGATAANITYTLRDASGSPITTGHGMMAAGQHISCFIDQLKDIASDFNLPANFQTAIQFGTLEITSTQPLSVLALRGTTNQRQQFLFTTTPVADLTQSPGSDPIYFAQLGDGGGYTTSIILMNTSVTNETGMLQIIDNNGAALTVHQAGGSSGSSFHYSIPPNGIFHFQTDGSSANANAGWVQLTPDSGTSVPVGSGVFGYNPVNVLVTESGVPSASATTHARIYVDLSGNHGTGLAIANINNASAAITINAFQTDGSTAAGIGNSSLTLAAYGHNSQFANQLIAGLPDGFTGLLDISSTKPFAALTMRSLYNENNDYLMTTFPIADMNQTAPSPIVFPHIADGGGYLTQFILLSAGGASSTAISYFDSNGQPLAVGR